MLLVLLAAQGDVLAHSGSVDRNGCHRETAVGGRHCHPERARASRAAKRESTLAPRAGDEGAFHGPLVAIADGDTLKVKVQGVIMDFRLADVDAPELDQPYGPEAKRELQSILRCQPLLVLVPFDTDRYGRTVAKVWLGDMEVNRELVRRGAAWFYSQYARNNALYLIEEQARDEKRGLWALPLRDRVEPWVWRHEQREEMEQRRRS